MFGDGGIIINVISINTRFIWEYGWNDIKRKIHLKVISIDQVRDHEPGAEECGGLEVGVRMDLELRQRWAAGDLGTEWGVQRRREENRV